ncbi:MAG: sensor histidine kinase [Planctomycetota bacterium]|nr:MAG: sensor histidine kinase [Planctomycetota bacterium]
MIVGDGDVRLTAATVDSCQVSMRGDLEYTARIMLGRGGYRVSLARKISLLFGTAVLLTIAVTLVFPQLQMTALNEQVLLLQAKRIATSAYQLVNLRRADWEGVSEELARVWPVLARRTGLPPTPPHLVPVSNALEGGFRAEAVARLQTHPQQRYYWRLQRNGTVFRFAMAVRGLPADPHPDALRGIIDVRLPAVSTASTWNIVVTVLAGASGAVLAILVFYIVTQRLVLSPVHALRRVAEKVTTGDLNVRADISSRDEFGELADAFNDMLAHLEAAQEEQRRINRSLDVRLEELARTNVALFESNRLKTEFLANVTHELRTPLISIIGFAELLRDAWQSPQVDPQRMARFADNILTSARSLLEIINDLLDLAKVEAGRMELHLTEFPLATLCRDLADFVRPLAAKRNQTLNVSLDDPLPTCRSDAGKIKQILYNLLSNAIKFTPTGGTVTLEARAESQERVVLHVRDTGPGIPPEDQETIFEKFKQLDASKTREHEGTGLGLAITRELVRMLGGRITLHSVVGAGSTFTVTLPIDLSDRTASDPAPSPERHDAQKASVQGHPNPRPDAAAPDPLDSPYGG